MSSPPQLRLPASVRAVQIATDRGVTPALLSRPEDSAEDSASKQSPVLLLPGFTGSKEDFLEILEPLADAGFPTLAIDLRGQNGSYLSEDPAEYELSELAADVLAVAKSPALGDLLPGDDSESPRRFHLLGHSFGGLVARAAALAQGDAWRSLTLLDSGPAALPEPGHRVALLRTLLEALPVQDLRAIYERKRELETAAGEPMHAPEVEHFLRERFLANCPTGLARMAEQLLVEPDTTDELAALSAAGLPVHVAYGQYDDAWSPSTQADMARRLRATETVITDAAHSPAVEQPKATVGALTAFWAAAEQRRAGRRPPDRSCPGRGG